jgi:non-canonical (house-cleaning) NTP pyrophosphatase
MTTLTGRSPKDAYKELLKVSSVGGATGAISVVTDGDGVPTPLKLSTTAIELDGSIKIGNLVWPATGSGSGKFLGVAAGGSSLEWVDLTTSNLAEGTNQYFTNARARSAISATGSATYNSTTGVISVPAAASAYDLVLNLSGKPTASAQVMTFATPRAFNLPAGLTNSVAKASSAATASSVFSIRKNGTQVGTATFAASGTVATFSMASLTSFAIGDILSIIAPASVDATLANLSITLVGTIV